MSKPLIIEDIKENVAYITLNNIEKRNALNANMIQLLSQTLEKVIAQEDVKIIVLQSAGEHFSAGADLNWMASQTHASLEENIEDARALAQLMATFYHSPKPTLCIVQGAAYGGAIGLVAASHIVIATDTAQFCFSEVKLGLIPAIISPYVINAIGPRQARYYFLNAQIFDAYKAKDLGLCHEVVQQRDLNTTLTSHIHHLKKNGPIALREVNLYLNQFEAITITPKLIQMTTKKIAELRQSAEGQEGMHAFLEKRQPNWIK